MGKNVTKELLVKYLYNETTTFESFMVEQALESNYEIQEEFQFLEKSIDAFPKVKFSPSKSTIDSILRYSSEQTAFDLEHA